MSIINLIKTYTPSSIGTVWTSNTTLSAAYIGENYDCRVAGNPSRYIMITPATSTSLNLYTSSDGVNWSSADSTSLNSAFSGVISGGSFFPIVWAFNKFFAFTTGGYWATSPNGITWTSQTRIGNYFNPYNVVFENNTLLVSGSKGSGTSSTMKSTDGVNWSYGTEAETKFKVVYCNHLSKWISSSGSLKLKTSTDGLTWTGGASGDFSRYIAYSPTLQRAVISTLDMTKIYYSSTDLATWTAVTIPYSTGSMTIESVHWALNKFIAIGYFYVSTTSFMHIVATSTDGISWSVVQYSPTKYTGFGGPGRDGVYVADNIIAIPNKNNSLFSIK